jgi:hypothetical protein
MAIVNNQVVNYKLDAFDVEDIKKRRLEHPDLFEGNKPREGDILPMVITGVWGDACVNGQVFLDGNDSIWKRSIQQGNAEGNWNFVMIWDE